MSVKSLRNQIMAFVVVGAFMIAQPDFARAEEPLLRGFYLQVEGRYLFSDGDELPHEVGINRNNGRVSILNMGDFGDDATGRGAVGFHFEENWDVGLSYSGLKVRKDDRDHGNAFYVTSLDFSYGDSTYYPLVGNGLNPPVNGYCPGSCYYGQAGFDHTSTAEYHVVDFEVGYSIKLGMTDVRVFGGLRYARFDQRYNFSQLYITDVTVGIRPFPKRYQRDVHAEGIGPRLGVTGNLPLGSGGFSLTGSVSGSVLFGDRDTEDSMAINFFNSGFLFFSSSADVPDNKDTFFNAEGEIGLSFPQELINASAIMITLGYRAEAWFDVNNTSNSFAIAVGRKAPPNNLLPFGTITGDREADLFFHGPFVRIGWNF